jgi:uncharacterized protein YbbC (DUF1343 family)
MFLTGRVDVAGPLLDPKYVSFVTYMPGFPIRHGMTMGEMARYFNAEKKLGADLHVIAMQGWRRSLWFDETGLEWVNPSPNIRNLTEAILYPGTCLLEGRSVSVGRGTDTPFEIVGAPWFRAREVAAYLNSLQLPGVRFVPRRFCPTASIYKGQECQGVDIQLVNREVFDPVLMGMELVAATIRFHPGKVELTTRLLGSDDRFGVPARDYPHRFHRHINLHRPGPRRLHRSSDQPRESYTPERSNQ